MVNVNVTGGEMSQAEINSYIDRAQKNNRLSCWNSRQI